MDLLFRFHVSFISMYILIEFALNENFLLIWAVYFFSLEQTHHWPSKILENILHFQFSSISWTQWSRWFWLFQLLLIADVSQANPTSLGQTFFISLSTYSCKSQGCLQSHQLLYFSNWCLFVTSYLMKCLGEHNIAYCMVFLWVLPPDHFNCRQLA